jgi:hypothetical protein
MQGKNKSFRRRDVRDTKDVLRRVITKSTVEEVFNSIKMTRGGARELLSNRKKVQEAVKESLRRILSDFSIPERYRE